MIQNLISSMLIEEIFSPANMFIMAIAIFWMIIASIEDFKKREVENWWNFSLIIFILVFKIFLSIETGDYRYFFGGIIGLFIGLGLCNLFYYGRMFAGGDAKLLIALGVILPMSLNWKDNLLILGSFLILLLALGAIYGLVYCLFITLLNLNNFKKEFKKQIKNNKSVYY